MLYLVSMYKSWSPLTISTKINITWVAQTPSSIPVIFVFERLPYLRGVERLKVAENRGVHTYKGLSLSDL